jgi:hypothetical protein
MTLKNTYVGVSPSGNMQIDYIKTTEELWLYTKGGGTTITIINPRTGVVSGTITTPEITPSFSTNFGYTPRCYNEKLNAFCFPSPMSGFSGDPYFYYFYDVVSRTIKKQLDVTTEFNLFSFNNYWGQGFNPTDGSVYFMGGPFNNTTNKGILVIGTS